MVPFAVDLGTSNTVAVVLGADGQVRPVLFDGHEQVPSAVHAGPDGTLVAGVDAERLARGDPAAFEPNPKRRVDDGTVLLGAHQVAVPDVLAAVLAMVLARVRLVGPPGPAVLTVPSGWGAARRAVLTDAAARAGLPDVTLVSEPVAAAAQHLVGHEVPAGAGLLVVDVGAGTSDVALVRVGADPVVLAQRGLDVGGLDVDAALVGILGGVVSAETPGVWQRLAEPVTAADRRDRLMLWQEVRAAKESLSRIGVAPVHVPGHPADLHLTREEVERVAAPLLSPVADLAADLVAEAGVEPHGVLLVGGGGRLPLLARLLHARLGVAPTVAERPETVVAEGALHATANKAPTEAPTGTPIAVPTETPTARPETTVGAAAARYRRRWLSPATLVLAMLCFLLPFATVSCTVSGYGRAEAGGSTEYSGLVLAVGGVPAVPSQDRRDPGQWREDRLEPQPLYLIALLVLGVALVPAVRRRRAVVAGLAVLAGLAVAVGQVVVLTELTDRVREQVTIQADKTARDYVGTGVGFWLTLVLLGLLIVGNTAAVLRSRRSGRHDLRRSFF